MTKLTKQAVIDALGDSPQAVDRELRAFSESASVLSSEHARLVDERPLQWVAVYGGRVAASGKSLKSLIAQLRKQGIPPEKAVVRFIDTEQRTLIL